MVITNKILVLIANKILVLIVIVGSNNQQFFITNKNWLLLVLIPQLQLDNPQESYQQYLPSWAPAEAGRCQWWWHEPSWCSLYQGNIMSFASEMLRIAEATSYMNVHDRIISNNVIIRLLLLHVCKCMYICIFNISIYI